MSQFPCVHHWQIETPSGAPEVAAHCYRCGANRTFPTVTSSVEPPPSWKTAPSARLQENARRAARRPAVG
jgi:hypothetical protein